MEELRLLVDLHLKGFRQGPGGDDETRLAMKLAGLDRSSPLKIADIGCGTGASAILLAKELHAQVTAVDFMPEFLHELELRAAEQGVADRITALQCSMDDLPFNAEQFDVIWSEGAVYNIGFESGISQWKHFLKPGGKLAVSEITWLSARRPEEIQKHWDREYPEMAAASVKISLLEKHGFSPAGYFVLPRHCWVENYYQPLEDRFEAFLDRHGRRPAAREIVEAERQEISLYQQFSRFFSYGFYVAEKF